MPPDPFQYVLRPESQSKLKQDIKERQDSKQVIDDFFVAQARTALSLGYPASALCLLELVEDRSSAACLLVEYYVRRLEVSPAQSLEALGGVLEKHGLADKWVVFSAFERFVEDGQALGLEESSITQKVMKHIETYDRPAQFSVLYKLALYYYRQGRLGEAL